MNDKLIVTQGLVEKLYTMQHDLKLYVNETARFTEETPQSEMKDALIISEEDCYELVSIRKRLSHIHLKLQNQFKANKPIGL